MNEKGVSRLIKKQYLISLKEVSSETGNGGKTVKDEHIISSEAIGYNSDASPVLQPNLNSLKKPNYHLKELKLWIFQLEFQLPIFQ